MALKVNSDVKFGVLGLQSLCMQIFNCLYGCFVNFGEEEEEEHETHNYYTCAAAGKNATHKTGSGLPEPVGEAGEGLIQFKPWHNSVKLRLK